MRAVLLAVLLFVTLPAVAQETGQSVISEDEARIILRENGYIDVNSILLSSGVWIAEVVSRDGRRVSVTIDGFSGLIMDRLVIRPGLAPAPVPGPPIAAPLPYPRVTVTPPKANVLNPKTGRFAPDDWMLERTRERLRGVTPPPGIRR